MKEATTFDIHVACDVLSDTLKKALTDDGYSRDGFQEITPGVVKPYHFGKHPFSRQDLETSWTRLEALLEGATASDFCGFAEAEIVPESYRRLIPFKRFNPLVEFPFEPIQQTTCPTGLHKAFDIHVVADLDTLDDRLDTLLATEHGYYVVDIVKESGKKVRCYTIQPMSIDQAPLALELLSAFFSRAGGMEGKLKLEVLHRFLRVPTSVAVPPVVAETLRPSSETFSDGITPS